jgi:CheY-like chemotaxis protein
MTGEHDSAHAGEVEAAQQETILVVENKHLVRTGVAMHLRDCGFQVIAAVRALDEAPEIRLVFSDVNMPGQMDGNDLARWLRRKRPAIKILLASGAGWPAGTSVEDVAWQKKPYSFF